MELTSEMRRLMARARERMAEQDAHGLAQRAANYRIDGRHAEFCGAFREILDMLVCEIERAVEDSARSVHDWAAEAADREQYNDVMAADLADQRRMDRVPTGTGWPVK